MKFTLGWLREHLDTDAPLLRITDTLSAIGLEVEGVEDRGAALAPFRIVRVAEAVQHPNADRLRACTVETGAGTVSVVCGAPNARAGMLAVLAPPGAVIPATGAVLKVGEIRGVRSEGMLLSLREMGLGEDHAGIVELPDDAPVGEGYARWAGLDDPVLEIAVTPNRGDALGVRGIARDLAAAGLGTLKPLPPVAVSASGASAIRWAIADPRACTWVLGRTVRGVRNGPSPDWLRRRLESVGLRPISALVDVTNLFTHDLCRPLHVFDADRVRGGVLTMRFGRPDIFAALNGRTLTPMDDDIVISDAEGADSLAGIVGGERTSCTEATTSVFIECALFDPVRIALSGRRHAINTDARARNERGLDVAFLPEALDRATALIQQLCGGAASEVTAAGAEPAWHRDATLRFDRLRTLGGADVPPEEALTVLERLGFTPRSRDAERVTVAVPPWRNDIAAPIVLDQAPELPPDRAAQAAAGCAAVEAECDLVEEVLRLRGLDAVPAASLPLATPVPAPALTPRAARAALARRVLAARGMLDCVTYGFVHSRLAERFAAVPEKLVLSNPIAADLDVMRPTPVMSLLSAAARNAARGCPDVALSELGAAYRDDTPGGQLTVAAGVRTGHTARLPLEVVRPLDAFDAKADVLAVLAALGVPAAALSITTDPIRWYHPGRSGVVRQGPKTVLATFGEVHPRVLAALDLAGPAVAFEVFLDAVPEPKRRRRGAPDLPAFQPVRRDFAFLVDAGVAADAVLRAARGADRTLIAGVTLFDRYAGERLPEGKVSLAVEVTLQPRERSLTDAEIEGVADRVVAAVSKATGATLRG